MMRSLSSPRPILYPQHGWARRVLDLDPRLAPAGTVGQVPPLRDDAFKPELAGVLENERPVFLVQVLVEAYARGRTRQNALKCRLARTLR